jgi:prepilin-type N-terminal cleavage/methylation domain-containing protein
MANQKGLTLVEVLTTLTLFSTLATVGYPPLLTWYQHAVLRSEVCALVGCLQRAKMEAVKTNAYVVVAAHPNGYSVFVDESKDWIRQDEEQEIVNCRLKSGMTLATNFHLPADKMRFGFRPNIKPGRFIFSNSSGKRMDVIVDTVGRIRVE